MNKHLTTSLQLISLIVFTFFLNGCASQILDSDAAQVIGDNEEYEEQLEIIDIEDVPATEEKAAQEAETETKETSSSANQDKKPEVKKVAASDVDEPQKKTAKEAKKASTKPMKEATEGAKAKKKKQAKEKSKKKKQAEPKSRDKSKQEEQVKKKATKDKGQKKMDVKTAEKRLPVIEDAEGFVGRRPKVDPFEIGERVTLSVSYFGVTAGELTLEVPKMAEVNGKKSYKYLVTVKSKGLFSRFYSVDDAAETYVDYETLLPYNLSIHVRESKQLKEIRNLFNWDKMKAHYWEKKVTDDKGVEKKKLDWELEPFSQNVISAVFYMRNFELTPGKTLKFRVADRGKNVLFKGKVLRRETIDTQVGKLRTIVIKPEFEIDGVFKPVGDILFWLTDDDQKLIVRIESEIKIGTLVSKLKSWDRGR